jgi:tol-pal system protein YbgF
MNKILRTRLLVGGSTALLLTVAAGAYAGVPPNVSARESSHVEASTAGLPSGSYRVADIFGESDEEKAERLRQYQQEQSQNSSIGYLRQRNDDLENTVRRLTGQIEQLDHRIAEQNARIERMQRDFEYRLCTLAGQQLGAAGGGEEAGALPCNPGGSSSSAPPAAPVAPGPPPIATTGAGATGAPTRLGAPPGTLGSLSANPPAAPGPAMAAGPNRSRFDSAMRLLAKAQYDEARSAFRTFADSYPTDELAPQALYWIGDIALVQKDYPGAARAFAEEIKKYPESARAPDSMLKLGQSLIAMGQKQEGCTALAALPTKYPAAAKTVIARAAAERKTSHCR